MAKRIHEGYKEYTRPKVKDGSIAEDIPHGHRRKGSKRGKLTLEEVLNILYRVVVEKQPNKDVAKEFRASPSRISSLVCKGRLNPKFLAEMYEARDKRLAKEKQIEEFVGELNGREHFIDSAHSIVSRIQDELALTVKVAEVRKVMKEMGMRYKKVVHIPLKANSERNLVLRQQWALRYLDILQHQKVVLAIDETWVTC